VAVITLSHLGKGDGNTEPVLFKGI
jgi:hypothetical protein